MDSYDTCLAISITDVYVCNNVGWMVQGFQNILSVEWRCICGGSRTNGQVQAAIVACFVALARFVTAEATYQTVFVVATLVIAHFLNIAAAVWDYRYWASECSHCHPKGGKEYNT